MYTYKYPHPAVTTDCVVFGYDGASISILLVERKFAPCQGKWALPGGFLNIDETLEEGASRELLEETSLDNVNLEQLHVFSAINRDPRERVLTVAFFCLVKKNLCKIAAGDDAENAQWFEWNNLPPLAFDHAEIIAMARTRLQDRIRTTDIAFSLLDEEFEIADLQQIYEVIHGKKYANDDFLLSMEDTKMLKRKDNNNTDNNNTKNLNSNPIVYSFDYNAYNEFLSSNEWHKSLFDF